ncbi:uncharacterized protein LOC116287697 isoform X2 [Actinia tenebrosa]|nr:uncharacterized protein LOC116287697 isoform X2 [Actinia tenebrosa]XP_031550233.1 uncharacterized protein LOC116287697 isoform X2 [Actinia tenebrosa]XP_031550234.1 uncharacterized protein LOC116287697 isoform X2 [Actinia tenebrosa]
MTTRLTPQGATLLVLFVAISMKLGEPASLNGDCDFNSGTLCAWKQERLDDFDWLVRGGPTPDRDTGPNAGSDGGNYLFIESSDKNLGKKAVLKLEGLNTIAGGPKCFSFKYFMFGRDIETLMVFQENRPIFTLSGPQGNRWMKATGRLFPAAQTKITIHGVVGIGPKGDIAIDEIEFLSDANCGKNEAKCPPIPSPFQGSSTCASPFKNPDEICKFECNEGFQLVGPERLRCLPFGTWNDKPPLCLNNPIKLRLAGLGPERPNAGRVEIQVGDTWGSICRDKWTQVNSELVCRTLGYKKPIATYIDVSTLKSPTGNLPIWLDNVVCDKGAQNPLEDCRHNGFGIHNCDVEGHSQDVAIECRNQTSPPIASVPATTESTKKVAFPLSAKIATGVGSLVLVLIIVLVVVCCIRRKKRRKSKDGENPQHVVVFSKDMEAETEDQEDKPSDPWEVNPKYITFMEELGQGAFGKVFKAIYQEPPPKEEQIIMAKLMGTPELIKNNRPKKMVAVKTLHGISVQQRIRSS